MPKPSVYLDSSYISAYWYKGANPAMLTRRFHSREWWMLERKQFRVVASTFVERELIAGDYAWKDKSVTMVRRLAYVQPTWASFEFTKELLEKSVIAKEEYFDAIHLGISTVNDIDYLLTWNYAHLANPLVQAKHDELCEKRSMRPPLLVSPESMPQTRFGQEIRRRKRK